MAMCACNPSIRESDVDGSLGLAGQPAQPVSELRVSKRLFPKNKVMWLRKTQISTSDLHIHMLTGAHMPMPTQELKHQEDVGVGARPRPWAPSEGSDSVFRKETQMLVQVLLNCLTNYQI